MPPSSPSHYYILREELNQKVNSFENSEFMYVIQVHCVNSALKIEISAINKQMQVKVLSMAQLTQRLKANFFGIFSSLHS